MTFAFLVCAIRTNVCLFLGLFLLEIAIGLFAGASFQAALGKMALAEKLQQVSFGFLRNFGYVRRELINSFITDWRSLCLRTYHSSLVLTYRTDFRGSGLSNCSSCRGFEHAGTGEIPKGKTAGGMNGAGDLLPCRRDSVPSIIFAFISDVHYICPFISL